MGELVNIREEQPEEIAAVRKVNREAFGQPQEAHLVEALRINCEDLLSLVAIMSGQIIGHVLFSPVTIHTHEKKTIGMGLGPMAVLPEYQRKGIGARLINFGIKRLRENGYPFIIVLGHPEYYPRFGFKPASGYRIRSEWDIPDNAFMVLVLDESKMQGTGLAQYRPEFSGIVWATEGFPQPDFGNPVNSTSSGLLLLQE
jgi:putative acetyltransferase